MKTHILNIFARFIPLCDNKVCFSSFSGLYNDNPKYISQYLHEIAPEIQQYWLIDSQRSKERLPDYIRPIPVNSLLSIYFKNRCKVIVENGIGISFAFVPAKRLSLYNLLKHPGQVDIATWHGIPLKRIGRDIINANPNNVLFTTATHCMLSSKFECEKFATAFPTIHAKVSGYPRNDVLIKYTEEKKLYYRNKLGLPLDKKILLYAPTFRDNIAFTKDRVKFDYLMNMDVKNVLRTCQSKFGGDWIMVFRGHQFVQDCAGFEAKNKYRDLIIDGNQHDDMAEYLCAIDILITDFSSSLFDISISNKPCFLYTPDYDDYINKTRGVYDIINEIPYKFCKTNQELMYEINCFDQSRYLDSLERFRILLGIPTSGDSSALVVDLILKCLKYSK